MSRRVFVLGAGFSKPAGMPLATELLGPLIDEVDVDDLREWLTGLQERLAWLTERDANPGSIALNIEQVFHYAYFDIEVFRLRQHSASVGRGDGPGTPWSQAESIRAWLRYLEDSLCDVILRSEDQADLRPIERWSKSLHDDDVVVTFNYDTLVESALTRTGSDWNHGTGRETDKGVPVYKLHGSVDWIVADRGEEFSKCDLLFDKRNENRGEDRTGHVEDDCRLWRCRTREQLRNWIGDRQVQLVPNGASPRSVGIAGLGAYKEVHRIPGLGHVWASGMRSLYDADLAVVVGFSMSEFDTMAQIQFVEVARARVREGRPLPVVLIDPYIDEPGKYRFRRAFRHVDFVEQKHEEFDWATIG